MDIANSASTPPLATHITYKNDVIKRPVVQPSVTQANFKGMILCVSVDETELPSQIGIQRQHERSISIRQGLVQPSPNTPRLPLTNKAPSLPEKISGAQLPNIDQRIQPAAYRAAPPNNEFDRKTGTRDHEGCADDQVYARPQLNRHANLFSLIMRKLRAPISVA
ncbi:hypothetical protein GQ44DRAFT_827791 [Phaeosphaeriaceae sp. PMI808]|nr:hypothetical protein GQ44DRAFT_827791 [Phaeosphaeriaceae sp. PMI808]